MKFRNVTSAVDGIEQHKGGIKRLARLESFEQRLFDRLNDPDLPEANRERIVGYTGEDDYTDGGLLGSVQDEIRSLLWLLPLWARNRELYQEEIEAWRRRQEAIDAVMIHQLCVPREITTWIKETTEGEPESAA